MKGLEIFLLGILKLNMICESSRVSMVNGLFLLWVSRVKREIQFYFTFVTKKLKIN